MKLYIKGGCRISSAGRETLREKTIPEFPPGQPKKIPVKEFYPKPLRHYGRFDDYTRLGFAAIGLALKDAGIPRDDTPKPVGAVIFTRSGSLANDLDFYRTTLEDDGALASPNLFSYTLPGTVLGECAVHFGLAGPTFCIGGKADPVRIASKMIESGEAETMIAGYLENTPESNANGAAVIVISKSGDVLL